MLPTFDTISQVSRPETCLAQTLSPANSPFLSPTLSRRSVVSQKYAETKSEYPSKSDSETASSRKLTRKAQNRAA